MRRPLRPLGPFILALLVAVLVQSLVPSLVNAQQQQEDVVLLKDGSVIRGEIIEDLIGEPLRIRTRDGNVLEIARDRIERRTRQAAGVTSGRKSPALAFTLSFLIVGAGQGYNGQWGKGLLMAGGVLASYAIWRNGWENCPSRVTDDLCAREKIGIGGMVTIALASWFDAPMTAEEINNELDARIALEVGPQLRLGFPSNALVGSVSRRRTSPQLGISLVRLRF